MRAKLDKPQAITGSNFALDSSSNSQVLIRPAQPEDAALAADLIYLSMGVEVDWLFGQEPGYPTRDVLPTPVPAQNNRVSYCLAYIAAWNGQDVGLLLAYPGRFLPRLDRMTGLHLAQIFGLGGVRAPGPPLAGLWGSDRDGERTNFISATWQFCRVFKDTASEKP